MPIFNQAGGNHFGRRIRAANLRTYAHSEYKGAADPPNTSPADAKFYSKLPPEVFENLGHPLETSGKSNGVTICSFCVLGPLI